jgi:hypothetical protein
MRLRGSAHAKDDQDLAFTRARRRHYQDELMDYYVSWRDACRSVAEAYESWRSAQRQDEALAFGAYASALDREEQAATAYQGAVAQLAAA